MLRRVRDPLVAVVVLAVVIAAGWWVSGTARAEVRSPLAAALAAAPAGTTVLGLTDWQRIRDVGSDDPGARDLTTRSVLDDLGDAVPNALGWSSDDVAWEAYVQDPTAAGVLVVAPGPDLSWSRLEAGFRRAGFADAGGGRWTASAEVLGTTGLGDQLADVRLLRRAGLLVAGSDSAAVEKVVRAATGRAPALTSVRRAVDTAAPLADADTVLLQAGSLGCEDAAVPAESADQAEAAQARAGRLAGYVYSPCASSGAGARTARHGSVRRTLRPGRGRAARPGGRGRPGHREPVLRPLRRRHRPHARHRRPPLRRLLTTSRTLRWSSRRRCDEGAGGGVSRPLQAFAGGRLALGRCRVVSIRRDFARSSLLLDQRNPPLVECLHERQRGEVYRDHSGRSLGAGSRWAVAGWSRYAARRSFVARAATRPAVGSAGRVVASAEGRDVR